MTKILVFGASGFAGRALVSDLSKYDYNVFAMTRSSIPDQDKLPAVSYIEVPDDQDLQLLNIENIDFVFLDGGHSYNTVINDLTYLYKNLKGKNKITFKFFFMKYVYI